MKEAMVKVIMTYFPIRKKYVQPAIAAAMKTSTAISMNAGVVSVIIPSSVLQVTQWVKIAVAWRKRHDHVRPTDLGLVLGRTGDVNRVRCVHCEV